MKTIKLKINKPIGAYHQGVVTVQVDDNDVPLQRFWRNRLRDAELDNCVEVVPARTSKAKKEKAE